uniref:RNase H type-1 domain-containing protein n=1 Tax=Brassica oleracea var. oleracea TaxID=109376 RepID=A0A0D3D375_BRAOL
MDAARRPQDRTAGCRWISYDSRFGETIQGTSTELFVTSPLMAEALAVREALLQARDFHLSNICLKSDNHVLIKALISKQHPVELYGINLDIENLSSSFSSTSFSYVPRSLNSAADALAKSALYHAHPLLRL